MTQPPTPAQLRALEAVATLRPCPFGCSVHPYLDPDGDDEMDPRYWVECGQCGARGPEWSNAEKAIAAWNTRPLLDRLDAVKGALLAAIVTLERVNEQGGLKWCAENGVTGGDLATAIESARAALDASA